MIVNWFEIESTRSFSFHPCLSAVNVIAKLSNRETDLEETMNGFNITRPSDKTSSQKLTSNTSPFNAHHLRRLPNGSPSAPHLVGVPEGVELPWLIWLITSFSRKKLTLGTPLKVFFLLDVCFFRIKTDTSQSKKNATF